MNQADKPCTNSSQTSQMSALCTILQLSPCSPFPPVGHTPVSRMDSGGLQGINCISYLVQQSGKTDSTINSLSVCMPRYLCSLWRLIHLLPIFPGTEDTGFTQPIFFLPLAFPISADWHYWYSNVRLLLAPVNRSGAGDGSSDPFWSWGKEESLTAGCPSMPPAWQPAQLSPVQQQVHPFTSDLSLPVACSFRNHFTTHCIFDCYVCT